MESTSCNINTPAALSLLDEGNTFLINGKPALALESYSKTIQALSDSNESNNVAAGLLFRSYSHRSEANLQLKKTAEALTDAEAALALMERNSLGDVLLQGELDMCRSRKDRASREINGKKLTAAKSTVKPLVPAATTAPVITKKKPPTMPKYQYYQNDSFMTISILESNVKPENLKVEFAVDELTVILEKDGVSFTVICGTLYDPVDVSKCKIVYKDEKVLIKLKKEEKHEWQNLFGKGRKSEEKNKTASKEGADVDAVKKEVPKIDPSKKQNRPYASHRDWDAIERDLKNEELNEKPEGEDAVNQLFRGIYKDADEDTRRAMIKSFQTSGGTCLSTNWNEVSKTDYEKKRTAPKGSEWKNWEGDRLPQED